MAELAAWLASLLVVVVVDGSLVPAEQATDTAPFVVELQRLGRLSDAQVHERALGVAAGVGGRPRVVLYPPVAVQVDRTRELVLGGKEVVGVHGRVRQPRAVVPADLQGVRDHTGLVRVPYQVVDLRQLVGVCRGATLAVRPVDNIRVLYADAIPTAGETDLSRPILRAGVRRCSLSRGGVAG